MTDKEKAIVMAYTGVCMLSGDKFKIFHEYVENIMGRPVYTHEMAITAVVDEIKEKAKADFIMLCAEQEPKVGHCEECKHFRKFPYHADTLGKCIRHTKLCPKSDWYCADYESQESEEDK